MTIANKNDSVEITEDQYNDIFFTAMKNAEERGCLKVSINLEKEHD